VRLLVGHDGGDGGRDALELARVFGTVTSARALVVTVQPFGRLPVPFAELEHDAAAEAEPVLEEARGRLSGLEVETRAFGGGSAAGVVTDLAEAEDVDLVVLGSPHRGAVGRALIGSVAQSVLHGSPCAVSVAPRGYAKAPHDPFRRVAVAYDGTPEAKAALSAATELAEKSRAGVWVLTVVAPPVSLPGAVGYTPVNPPDPDRVVEEGVRLVGDRAPVEGRRLDGSPAPVIAEACEEGVDLLVAGSRGYGPAMRVLLGSVSTRLVNTAPCPVMVVPRP
jgi:nucleotide-binding universal stress UspA family protein